MSAGAFALYIDQAAGGGPHALIRRGIPLPPPSAAVRRGPPTIGRSRSESSSQSARARRPPSLLRSSGGMLIGPHGPTLGSRSGGAWSIRTQEEADDPVCMAARHL